jgi:hypothetical protein
MFLHAYKLAFSLDRDYEIIAPLGEEWQTLFSLLNSE